MSAKLAAPWRASRSSGAGDPWTPIGTTRSDPAVASATATPIHGRTRPSFTIGARPIGDVWSGKCPRGALPFHPDNGDLYGFSRRTPIRGADHRYSCSLSARRRRATAPIGKSRPIQIAARNCGISPSLNSKTSPCCFRSWSMDSMVACVSPVASSSRGAVELPLTRRVSTT